MFAGDRVKPDECLIEGDMLDDEVELLREPKSIGRAPRSGKCRLTLIAVMGTEVTTPVAVEHADKPTHIRAEMPAGDHVLAYSPLVEELLVAPSELLDERTNARLSELLVLHLIVDPPTLEPNVDV